MHASERGRPSALTFDIAAGTMRQKRLQGNPADNQAAEPTNLATCSPAFSKQETFVNRDKIPAHGHHAQRCAFRHEYHSGAAQ